MSKKESDIPNMVFSFQYYDINEEKWCISRWEKEEVKKALIALMEINRKRIPDLKAKTWHFHPVRWKETIYPNGFTNRSLEEMEHFQIALPSVNKSLTRVFGVLQRHIFYVVWFDLNHEIWPTDLKNT